MEAAPFSMMSGRRKRLTTDNEMYCPSCEQWKPLTPEYWARSNRCKNGFSTPCKACLSKKYLQTSNKEKRRQRNRELATRGLKLCSVCQAELPFDQFSKNQRSKDGYAPQCKACLHAYRRKKPEQYKKQKQAWLKQNRERVRGIKNAWKQRNPDKVSHLSMKRRRKVRELPFSFAMDDWERCKEYWGYRCCICGKPEGFWRTLARDHWIPVRDPRSDNPGTVPWNILPLCHSVKGGEGGCNNSKGYKDPIEWLVEKLGKKKAAEKLKEIEAYFEWVKREGGE